MLKIEPNGYCEQCKQHVDKTIVFNESHPIATVKLVCVCEECVEKAFRLLTGEDPYKTYVCAICDEVEV